MFNPGHKKKFNSVEIGWVAENQVGPLRCNDFAERNMRKSTSGIYRKTRDG
jgi:hypothetical protein